MTFGKDLKAWCGKSLKFLLGFKQIIGPIHQCLKDSSLQFLSLSTTDADEFFQPKNSFVSIPTETPAKYFKEVG